MIKIGQFRAFDYFDDGSFYLLETSGYAIGHLGGLVRTTVSPDTFIFCGGNISQHSGELRPNQHLPFPAEVDPSILATTTGKGCPKIVLENLQKSRSRKVDEPFFDPNMGLDIEEVIRTIRKTQEFDASDNVLYLFAHDSHLRNVGDFFPKSANEWHAKGWRDKLLWAFLEDFKEAVDDIPGSDR